MQIHGDHMVTACRLQHIGHQFCRNRCAGPVFFVLAGVGKIGDDGGDAARGGGFAGGDHDEEFHDSVVDVTRGGGLEDEDWSGGGNRLVDWHWERANGQSVTIFISDGFANGHRRFLVRVLQDHDLGQVNAQALDVLAQMLVV